MQTKYNIMFTLLIWNDRYSMKHVYDPKVIYKVGYISMQTKKMYWEIQIASSCIKLLPARQFICELY